MHRYVLFVENDTMLVVINVRTVLQEEILPSQFDRNYTVILSCGMIESAGVAFIFCTEQALRVSRSLGFACSSYCLRVFLGLGQINCYIQRSVLRIHGPFAVFRDAVSPYVIRISREVIVPFSRFFR